MRNGAELVRAGYLTISRRYRIVARVPPGKTAREAVCEAAMRQVHEHGGLPASTVAYWTRTYREWANKLGERECVEYYIRTYATGEDRLILTVEEFTSFRAAVNGSSTL